MLEHDDPHGWFSDQIGFGSKRNDQGLGTGGWGARTGDSRREGRGWGGGPGLPPPTTARLCVSYIRHTGTRSFIFEII